MSSMLSMLSMSSTQSTRSTSSTMSTPPSAPPPSPPAPSPLERLEACAALAEELLRHWLIQASALPPDALDIRQISIATHALYRLTAVRRGLIELAASLTGGAPAPNPPGHSGAAGLPASPGAGQSSSAFKALAQDLRRESAPIFSLYGRSSSSRLPAATRAQAAPGLRALADSLDGLLLPDPNLISVPPPASASDQTSALTPDLTLAPIPAAAASAAPLASGPSVSAAEPSPPPVPEVPTIAPIAAVPPCRVIPSPRVRGPVPLYLKKTLTLLGALVSPDGSGPAGPSPVQPGSLAPSAFAATPAPLHSSANQAACGPATPGWASATGPHDLDSHPAVSRFLPHQSWRAPPKLAPPLLARHPNFFLPLVKILPFGHACACTAVRIGGWAI